MPKLATIDKCTGCAACNNICTKHAITMKEDNEGYLQPHINTTLCVECGLCEKICPALSSVTQNNPTPKVYAMWSNKDRIKSSSGGAFSAFARFVLDKGGLVFGAVYDSNLVLHHTCVDTVEELDKMRGSKYVQSNIGKTFIQVKEALKEKRWVLFCGTPCQVSGLKAYLRKEYETLLTLDLICHGVPSNRIFQAYLSKLKEELHLSGIKHFEFRNREGWGYAPTLTDKKIINTLFVE